MNTEDKATLLKDSFKFKFQDEEELESFIKECKEKKFFFPDYINSDGSKVIYYYYYMFKFRPYVSKQEYLDSPLPIKNVLELDEIINIVIKDRASRINKLYELEGSLDLELCINKVLLEHLDVSEDKQKHKEYILKEKINLLDKTKKIVRLELSRL